MITIEQPHVGRRHHVMSPLDVFRKHFFQYKNAVLNCEQEKEFINRVRMG